MITKVLINCTKMTMEMTCSDRQQMVKKIVTKVQKNFMKKLIQSLETTSISQTVHVAHSKQKTKSLLLMKK